MTDVTPSKNTASLPESGVTPLRNALEKLNLNGIAQADPEEVTHKDKLELLSQLYSLFIDGK